jgi:hypothetical protein
MSECTVLQANVLIQRREFTNHHAREASLFTSTAPHDLAAIKHALELELLLAALVLAAAAHGDTRPDPDLTAAPDIAAKHTPGLAPLRLNFYSTDMIGRQK